MKRGQVLTLEDEENSALNLSGGYRWCYSIQSQCLAIPEHHKIWGLGLGGVGVEFMKASQAKIGRLKGFPKRNSRRMLAIMWLSLALSPTCASALLFFFSSQLESWDLILRSTVSQSSSDKRSCLWLYWLGHNQKMLHEVIQSPISVETSWRASCPCRGVECHKNAFQPTSIHSDNPPRILSQAVQRTDPGTNEVQDVESCHVGGWNFCHGRGEASNPNLRRLTEAWLGCPR